MIQFLIFVLSFLGLLAGVAIAFFTKEELRPGKKYFTWLERLILLSMGLVIISYVREFLMFFILGAVVGFVFRRVYFYFGIALALASGQLLLLLSSLVFVFGLPRGSLLVYRLKRKDVMKDIIFSAVFFFIAVLVSYFLSYKFLLMFVSGALIFNSFSKRL